jgi:hypothetical protein
VNQSDVAAAEVQNESVISAKMVSQENGASLSDESALVVSEIYRYAAGSEEAKESIPLAVREKIKTYETWPIVNIEDHNDGIYTVNLFYSDAVGSLSFDVTIFDGRVRPRRFEVIHIKENRKAEVKVVE